MLDNGFIVIAFSALGGLVLGFLSQRRQSAGAALLETKEQRHLRKVERIVREVREHTSEHPIHRRKKVVSHQVPHSKKRSPVRIDIADLNEIISIDPKNRTCVAEPGVTFHDLVRETLKYNLIPAVVPDFKTVTLGGAVAGGSIESTSFRYGGFHDTCSEYEIIAATGEVLTCTPENENQLLFQMIHATFGTLGIISKLTFKLIPAHPYVHLTYEHHEKLEDYFVALKAHHEAENVDFIDGIIHGPSHAVLCIGRFVSQAPYTHRYDWMKIYYQSTATRKEDYLTAVDYFFRYDKGVTNVHPRSFLARLLLGKFLSSNEILRLVEIFPWMVSRERPEVILDMLVPLSRSCEFLAWHEKEFQFYPLWCVPYKRIRDHEWLSTEFLTSLKDDLFIDFGIYGMPQRPNRNDYEVLEEKLTEIGGIKWLISHNYYKAEHFWKTWNKSNYEKIKRLVDPKNRFGDFYEKACSTIAGRKTKS